MMTRKTMPVSAKIEQKLACCVSGDDEEKGESRRAGVE